MKTSVMGLPALLCLVGGSLLVLGAAGCTTGSNLPVYSPGEVNQVHSHDTGTVQVVRAVILEGETGSQRSIGQSVGSSVGRGLATGVDPGYVLGGAAGSIVGSIVGSKVEQRALRREGQEITVLLDNGLTVVVVQDNNPPFIGGERVRVIRTGNRAEVMPNVDNDPIYTGSPSASPVPSSSGRFSL